MKKGAWGKAIFRKVYMVSVDLNRHKQMLTGCLKNDIRF